MIVYADILLLVNLYVDYFILLSVKNFLHLRSNNTRLLLGALLGAVFSLVVLFVTNQIVNYVLSAVLGCFICAIAFNFKNKAALLKAYICFIFLSFTFSGIVYSLSFLTSNACIIGGKPYFQISPIILFLFTVITYFVSQAYRFFISGEGSDFDFCKIIIEQNGIKYEVFAKKDTGNNLVEPFSGLPVMVVEKNSVKNISENNFEVFRVIPFNSLGGNGLLPAFKPEKIYIKKSGKEIDCYLALYDGELSTGSFNSLINPEIL